MQKVFYDSNFSKSFYSTELNQSKYDEFYEKATKIRDLKNLLSKEISSNILKYLNFSKVDSIKYFVEYLRTNHSNKLDGLSGQDIQHAIVHVYTSYENKFKAIKNKISFSIQKEIKITYYKRNGKSFKKEDLKELLETHNYSGTEMCLKT